MEHEINRHAQDLKNLISCFILDFCVGSLGVYDRYLLDVRNMMSSGVY